MVVLHYARRGTFSQDLDLTFITCHNSFWKHGNWSLLKILALLWKPTEMMISIICIDTLFEASHNYTSFDSISTAMRIRGYSRTVTSLTSNLLWIIVATHDVFKTWCHTMSYGIVLRRLKTCQRLCRHIPWILMKLPRFNAIGSVILQQCQVCAVYVDR